MPVKLTNIGSIAPNSTGEVEVTSDLNLVGTPPPVYRVNGVPIPTGYNATQISLSPQVSTWTTVQGAVAGLNTAVSGIVSSQWVNGAGGAIYYNGGNVGIGIATPGSALTVVNTLAVNRWANDASSGTMYYWKARGTQASPQPVQTGDRLLYFGWAGQNAGMIANHGMIEAVVGTNLRSSYLAFWLNDGTDNAVNGHGFERMRITSDGNVGIGVTNPVATLSVANTLTVSRWSNDDATGLIYFWKTRGMQASPQQIQTNDVLLYFGWGGLVTGFNANQGAIQAIAGADTRSSDLLFYLNDGTDNRPNMSGYERMRITSAGYVGIGTSNPQAPLHVAGTINCRDIFAARSGNTGYLFLGTDTVHYVGFDGANYQMPAGDLFVNGVHVPSDARLKRYIEPVTGDPLAVLNGLNFVRYEHNGLGGTVQGTRGIGLIAQEVQTVLPEAVGNRHQENGEDLLSINYQPLYIQGLRAIVELAARLKQLEDRVYVSQ